MKTNLRTIKLYDIILPEDAISHSKDKDDLESIIYDKTKLTHVFLVTDVELTDLRKMFEVLHF